MAAPQEYKYNENYTYAYKVDEQSGIALAY
jgi:hypothetical protein